MAAQATVTVVAPEDSNPEKGYLSCLSPLGASLLDGKAGDTKEIRVFGRRYIFIILNVF